MLFGVEGHHCNLLIQIVKQKHKLECEVIIRVNWCPGLGWDWSNFSPVETRTSGHLERCLIPLSFPQTWVYECCRGQAVFGRGGSLGGNVPVLLVMESRGKAGMGLGTHPLCHGCCWSAHGTHRHEVLGCLLSPGSWESREWALLWVPSGEMDSRDISREAFPVPSSCTLVKSKSKIQKWKDVKGKKKNLFQVTLLVACYSSSLLVSNKKSRFHAF